MYLTEKNGAEAPPHWVYYTYDVYLSHSSSVPLTYTLVTSWGIGLFLYQSLDAIDGYVSLPVSTTLDMTYDLSKETS